MKGISDLIDSDVEQSSGILDENSILSSGSETTNQAFNKDTASQNKKPKKRHRVTMPKSRSRVTKSSTTNLKKTGAKKTTGAKRKALEEHASNQKQTDEDEGDNLETAHEVAKPKPRGRPTSKATIAKHNTEADIHSDAEAMDMDQTPLVAQSSHAPNRSSKPPQKVVKRSTTSSKPKEPKSTARSTVSQQQPESVAVETEDMDDDDSVMTLQPRIESRKPSRIRQETVTRRRAGSASDTERGDPNLRRKLGDVTRKFENVDLKYRNLKEVAINEANTNMEKLRKQCEAQTQASNDLIASLKKELAMQAPLAQETRKREKQIQSQEAEMTQLRSTAAELASSLRSAQNEIKGLQAKVNAARSSATNVENSHGRTPGSAIKSNGPARTAVAGHAEAAQAAHVAQLKEDLYSDLTGLIIRSVKRTGEGDTYDCIQTGRNGTLHFKLYLDHEDAKSTSFEETEFLYTPLLDNNRDHEMIELMPQYLTEDITFARQNAAKFYARVVDTLTKRRTDE